MSKTCFFVCAIFVLLPLALALFFGLWQLFFSDPNELTKTCHITDDSGIFYSRPTKASPSTTEYAPKSQHYHRSFDRSAEAFNQSAEEPYWLIDFPNLEVLTIKNTTARSIPTLEVFPHLRKFNLERNLQLVELPNGFFSGNPNLEEIVIRSNVGMDVKFPENFLSGLEELRSFELVHHKAALSEDLFQNLSKLENIHLETLLRPNAIPANIFRNLESLESLKIAYAAIWLDEMFFQDLKSLQKLEIRGVRTDKIGATLFENLSNLVELKLPTNAIKSIEKTAFDNLQSLEKLNLERNNLILLSSSQNEFSWSDLIRLPSLKELALTQNDFKKFSQKIDLNVFKVEPILSTKGCLRDTDTYTLKIHLEDLNSAHFIAWDPVQSQNGIDLATCFSISSRF